MSGKKRLFSRKDGVYLKDIDPFMRFFPYIMKGRNEAAIYFSQAIDVTELKAYIRKRNREVAVSRNGSIVTIFHTVITALVKTATERPHINRFVIGRRVYQRNEFSCSFVMKREFSEEGKEEILTLRFKPDETLDTISRRISGEVKKTRETLKNEDKERHGILNLFNYIMSLPRFFLRGVVAFLFWLDYHGWLPKIIIDNDPMHASLWLSNLGSLGVDAPFHHLYEWGTTSIFATIGVIKKEPRVMPDGTIAVRDIMNVAVTLDERIGDGFYYSMALKRFVEILENPEELEKPSTPGELPAPKHTIPPKKTTATAPTESSREISMDPDEETEDEPTVAAMTP